jgi:hypothetical protein
MWERFGAVVSFSDSEAILCEVSGVRLKGLGLFTINRI